MRRLILTIAALGTLVLLTAGSCGEPSAQDEESARQQGNYEWLAERQPAQPAQFSPTRETINFWIETWGTEPGKLSYVYLLASNGQLVGYFIFEGLPVSYCASLTPTYRWERGGGSGAVDQQVPAPAMDGVYYSGGQCNAYYGKDAVSGSYMEYTIGNGLSALIYEEPLPRQDVEPLGVATIETVGQ